MELLVCSPVHCPGQKDKLEEPNTCPCNAPSFHTSIVLFHHYECYTLSAGKRHPYRVHRAKCPALPLRGAGSQGLGGRGPPQREIVSLTDGVLTLVLRVDVWPGILECNVACSQNISSVCVTVPGKTGHSTQISDVEILVPP